MPPHPLHRWHARLRRSARAFFSLLAFIALGILPAARAAAAGVERTDVYFAGIAFTGDKSTTTEAFPHSDRIIHAEGGQAGISQALWAGFAQMPPEHLTIRADLAALDGSTSAVALAAAIDRETVVIEQVGDQYKVLVEIAANALFFDFREKMVVASKPLTLQRIDILDAPPEPTEISAVVNHLLTGNGSDAFTANFVAAVREVRIPSTSTRRMQVTDISLDDTSLAALQSAGRSADMLSQTLANEFTKILGDRERISLLPFQKGQAIGGAMSARFADGKVYMLTIPKPDYAIAIKVGPLKSKPVQQTAVAINTLYGAYFNVSVTEPLSGKSYFQRDLRQGSTKATPITQINVDHAAAHYENLLIGFDAFASAISDPRSKWTKEQLDSRPLPKELKQLSELVRTCR